jgi:cell division protein ZapA
VGVKDSDGVRVVIYDQEYYMRGDLDQEYIQGLAQYLDAKMRAIAGKTRTVDSLRVAILAGLNIADEYHQLKAQQEHAAERVDKKVEKCAQLLDEFLKDSA